MDGTLLDSMFIWEDVSVNYLLAHGKTPREGLREEFKKTSSEQGAQYLIDEYGVEQTVQEITDEIYNMVKTRYEREAVLKEGITELLESIRAAKLPMCVATATDREIVESVLRRLGILHYFSGIFTCSEVGGSKREPEIFLQAAEHLGTSPENTAVFEDSFFAVKSAKSAGFFVVGVFDRFEARNWEQIKSTADICITDFDYKSIFER